jgi:hypothetical protein
MPIRAKADGSMEREEPHHGFIVAFATDRLLHTFAVGTGSPGLGAE